MADRRKLKPEGKKDPSFIVTVLSSCSIKIYGTTDPVEAKTRAVNRVRALFDGTDAGIYIPRVIVMPYGLSEDEVRALMNRIASGGESLVRKQEFDQSLNVVDPELTDDDMPTNEQISDILAMANVMVEPAIIETWTSQEKRDAVEYAGDCHYAASDNDVGAIKAPEFLKRYGARDYGKNS